MLCMWASIVFGVLLVRTMDEVLEGALLTLPFGRADAAAKEFLDGAQGPGVQLSQ